MTFDRWWAPPLLVFCLALLVLAAAVISWGSNRDLDGGTGDASQYLALGRSLADGHGYKDTVGPWPDRPAYDRMPGWPAVIAIALKLAPWVPDRAAVRCAGAGCLALAAAFFTMLHRKLGVRPGLSVLGGLGVAFSPGAISFVLSGISETLFLLLTVAAVVALLSGERWHFLAALCFGLAPLVRTNFVLMPVLIFLLLLIFPKVRREFLPEKPARLVILLLIAYLPVILWAARNYPLTGRAFFLSSIEGETLYGSNNEVVATNLAYWGYWVVPDEIPGGAHKLDLALGHTDLYLNDYYHAQAKAWIRANLRDYPRLVLGKLIRGFVPVPWVPLVGSYVAFGYRFLLDVLFIVSARWWLPTGNRLFLMLVVAMFSIVLITTAVYYGSFRFTHCAELFFIPCILLGWQRWRDERHSQAIG